MQMQTGRVTTFRSLALAVLGCVTLSLDDVVTRCILFWTWYKERTRSEENKENITLDGLEIFMGASGIK